MSFAVIAILNLLHFVLSEARVAHLCSDLERKVNRFNSIGCFVKASTLYSDLSSTMLHSLTHYMTQLLHIDWSSQYCTDPPLCGVAQW